MRKREYLEKVIPLCGDCWFRARCFISRRFEDAEKRLDTAA